MFVNGEHLIISQFEKISLNSNINMQPKADRPPVCPKNLPQLHLTPSGGGQKRGDGSQPSHAVRSLINIFQVLMFVNGEHLIISKFEKISLNPNINMQPKADRPPVCPKNLPQLHLTPSGGGQKRGDGSQQGGSNPWLLKPQHDIPATPPPQANPQPMEFFPQRIG
ncbi:unnamed protein product [Chrysodeixis includens]|uniref:Uncharacterized protein n=1 Tax=Chrysodeixis includens TaxID=689277 RepID=A0A9N8KX44_CHRIL|nr:unnamed protein product [Chrysodeixis includens]